MTNIYVQLQLIIPTIAQSIEWGEKINLLKGI